MNVSLFKSQTKIVEWQSPVELHRHFCGSVARAFNENQQLAAANEKPMQICWLSSVQPNIYTIERDLGLSSVDAFISYLKSSKQETQQSQQQQHQALDELQFLWRCQTAKQIEMKAHTQIYAYTQMYSYIYVYTRQQSRSRIELTLNSVCANEAHWIFARNFLPPSAGKAHNNICPN